MLYVLGYNYYYKDCITYISTSHPTCQNKQYLCIISKYCVMIITIRLALLLKLTVLYVFCKDLLLMDLNKTPFATYSYVYLMNKHCVILY